MQKKDIIIKRRALLVAINDYDCGSNLSGCVPDALALEKKLISLGYEVIKLLNADASRDNWLAELASLAKWTQTAGDMAKAFHGHSHHGSQEPDATEPDGLRELWCPRDWPNKITDKDVSAILDTVHPQARFLDWADCCHAAGSTRELFFRNERPRFIPNPACEGRWLILGTPVETENRPNIMQFAACRSNQTSADAVIEGKPCGAFTYYGLQSWTPSVTTGGLIDLSAQLLSRNGYSQRPEFCGTSDNANITMEAVA